jgi:hypothetical protein
VLSRLVLALCFSVAACATAQSAAQKDPMRCERDPNCVRGRGSYIDCDKQCSDNPECVDRCRQTQADPGVGEH